MRSVLKFVALAVIALSARPALNAQDLAPPAYLITPVHSNAVTLSYSYSSGDIIFGSTLSIV